MPHDGLEISHIPVARSLAIRCQAFSGKESSMARCEVCGNDYDKSFEVTVGGASHVFDSFECAIHALAPR
jgi:hypothetical protein